ncbi:uncharacterized protein LOC105197110 isoform X2 [Solenopsis invicta]|uniref:uncharacterized protein LOC105197110 isoform X2 n=1 Tax=Solenopsis invicta TaxID=13686 RepID=UPI00193D4C16|nr:uncharacterized protein LOC105197110 isoform X2 [Solenopsis invicta]
MIVTQSCRKFRLDCRTSKNEDNQLNFLKLPSKLQNYCQDSVVNRQVTKAKLFTREIDEITTPQHISNIVSSASYICQQKYEPPAVTFEEKYLSDGEKFERKFNKKICNNRKQSSTPRIVRAIRQNSKKRNSKSSVVVLYHGNFNNPPSSSSKDFVQLSKSDQAVKTSYISQSHVTNPASPDKTKIIETPETLSPRYSLRRRKTISKRYRHTSGQQPSLNVNIYHANRVERFVSPLQHQWLSLKRQTGINSKYKNLEYTDQLPKNLINSQSKTISCHLKKHVTNQRSRKCSEEERSWEKQCSFVEVAASKSMDHCSEKVETENIKDQKQSKLCPSLSRQQIQIHPKETSVKSAFVNTHKSDETSRVFPFQATSSGNLKIIPNQVVFESKKFSILVADPRHTKVNVKAEFNQSGANVGTSDSSNQTRYIDFPPGITPSTIDQLQLQAQKKLPYVEGNYKSRTRPNTKFYSEMEHNHSVQSTSHQLPPINEVPLASLGFTSEQPINWNNIILPEKTDLYQELTRRITNYKQIPNQTTTIAHAGSRLGNIINTMQSRIAEASQSGDKNVDIEKCQTPMDVDLVKGIWKRLSEEIMEQIDTSTSKLMKWKF